MVMPIRADPNFDAKRKAILDILGERAIVPDTQTSHREAVFDIGLATESFKSVALVIADLSFERPSCYFEIGMVQALGIPCFLIAEDGTQIHQHSGEVYFYKDIDGFQRLIELSLKGRSPNEFQQ